MFAETLKDHNANVQKWRAAEKDIEGARRAPRRRLPDTPTTAVASRGGRGPRRGAVVRTVPPAKAPAAADQKPPRPSRSRDRQAAADEARQVGGQAQHGAALPAFDAAPTCSACCRDGVARPNGRAGGMLEALT